MPNWNDGPKLNLNGLAYFKGKLDDTYAKQDGSYESMTVGNAEQLVATVGVEDKVPYIYRTSGGSADIGDREVDKLVGGTIAWNQRFPYQTINYTGTNYTLTSSGDGVWTLTVTGTATEGAGVNHSNIPASAFTANHVHLLVGEVTRDGIQVILKAYPKGMISLYKPTTAKYTNIAVSFTDLPAGTYKLYPQIFDITQMFGSTIADYAYALEVAHTGDGVAWLKRMGFFTKSYYPYNTGTLLTVNASAHKMVGFNQWDEEWELGAISSANGGNYDADTCIRSKNYIPVVQGTSYYVKCPENMTFRYYDASKNFIGVYDKNNLGDGKNQVRTTPDNCGYIRFQMYNAYGTTYNHDICINLSWDGERDGEYEPYSTWSYPLDDSLTLRGIPKLDADNQLYYDGDTYESDGTVTRKYGIVDLGTLTWQYYSDYQMFYPTAPVSGKAKGVTNIICSKYPTLPSTADIWNTSNNYAIQGNNSNGVIYIRDTSLGTDATAFKTAMNGVYLVYELAEATAEEAEPYQNPQKVDDFGTEEYVVTEQSGVAVPVGHETTYQANLRAKLEMAPDSPNGDGDYIVRQSGGQNTYVPITFPADELPAAPTTDGNYMLKCAVSSGTATFTWEAIT